MPEVRVLMLDVLSRTYNRRGVLLTSNSVLAYFECRSVQEIYLQIAEIDSASTYNRLGVCMTITAICFSNTIPVELVLWVLSFVVSIYYTNYVPIPVFYLPRANGYGYYLNPVMALFQHLLNYEDSYLCNGQFDSQFASLPVCQPANLPVSQFPSQPVCQPVVSRTF